VKDPVFLDYLIVEEVGSRDCAEQVAELLAEGWAPWGSPFTCGKLNTEDDFSVCQAMVKYEGRGRP